MPPEPSPADPIPRRPHDVIPRSALIQAWVALTFLADRNKNPADQRAADAIERALRGSDDDAFVLVEVSHVR